MACAEITEKLSLDFALKCFLSPIFEKRIYGLTHINEVISNLRVWDSSFNRDREYNRDYNGMSGSTTMSGGSIMYGPASAPRDSKWLDVS
jgi:hypothetical protein